MPSKLHTYADLSASRHPCLISRHIAHFKALERHYTTINAFLLYQFAGPKCPVFFYFFYFLILFRKKFLKKINYLQKFMCTYTFKQLLFTCTAKLLQNYTITYSQYPNLQNDIFDTTTRFKGVYYKGCLF